MITKGLPQEAKPGVLFYLGDCNAKFTTSTETIVYQREIDFSKIDYLFYVLSGHMTGATGTSYIKLYVGGTLKVTCTIPDATVVTETGRYDATSDTGKKAVKVTCAGSTDDLLIDGIYIGVVDS